MLIEKIPSSSHIKFLSLFLFLSGPEQMMVLTYHFLLSAGCRRAQNTHRKRLSVYVCVWERSPPALQLFYCSASSFWLLVWESSVYRKRVAALMLFKYLQVRERVSEWVPHKCMRCSRGITRRLFCHWLGDETERFNASGWPSSDEKYLHQKTQFALAYSKTKRRGRISQHETAQSQVCKFLWDGSS